MNAKKIILLGIITVLIASCSDYLEPYPGAVRTGDDLWKYPEMARGLIGQAYDFIPTNYNNNEG